MDRKLSEEELALILRADGEFGRCGRTDLRCPRCGGELHQLRNGSGWVNFRGL